MSFGSTRIGGAKYGNTLVFQESGGSEIPSRAVDYIETDGNAYINTEVLAESPRLVQLIVTPVAPSSGNSYICGVSQNGSRITPLLITSAGVAGCAYGASVYNSTTSGVSVSNSISSRKPFQARAMLQKGTLTFAVKQEGDSSWTTRRPTNNATISGPATFPLFGFNSDGVITPCMAGQRIHECQIYGDVNRENLLFDGIAWYYNGEFGMWDKVSNSFIGNAAGIGSFIGPQI